MRKSSVHICMAGHRSAHIICGAEPFRHDGFQLLDHMFPEDPAMKAGMLPWRALATTCIWHTGEGSRLHILSAIKGVQVQVAKLSARMKEREEQLSEAQDCYSKLDAIYQAERADNSAALSSKVRLKFPGCCRLRLSMHRAASLVSRSL